MGYALKGRLKTRFKVSDGLLHWDGYENFFQFIRLETSCLGVAFKYSGLNLNQYGVASPCRTICTVCGFVALS
ncbi:hypothetical protein MCC93_19370 [Morococcus cerebrosus]|uniref:Uncharacterized protein n=1 Tax=Morococcus cerebrosus TaxID=1056807 RepID=A0A0C1E411_9NEIS|nr:hypothetical protein MCC93_19370 [Morococcus cerebrosus]